MLNDVKENMKILRRERRYLKKGTKLLEIKKIQYSSKFIV